jgi:hypothetical protein
MIKCCEIITCEKDKLCYTGCIAENGSTTEWNESGWDDMSHTLNEMQRRQYAATLSNVYGYRGAAVVHEIIGLVLNTITRGKKELSQPAESRRFQ